MPTPRNVDPSRLALPFFAAQHLQVHDETVRWLDAEPGIDDLEEGDYAARSRAYVRSLGRSGLIRHMIPHAGADADVRSSCIVRETLCYRSALSDSAYVTQGLGAAAIWQHGTEEQKSSYLDSIANGTLIPAIALSEPEGGSDVAATRTTARPDGTDFVIDGLKTWTSNAGIADVYLVFARTGEAPGARGLSAFLVHAGTAGLAVLDPIVVTAPHPMASLAFDNCRVPASARVGEAGKGFLLAMSTLDIFRPTVGAAALGLARRALDETLLRVTRRRLFGRLMSEMDTVQMKLAEMHVDLETAALAVYRAAWLHDREPSRRITSDASLAKLVGTEAAFRVVDTAVQLFGGCGVTRGCIIEQLFRDVRAFRIYEGASEVQKLVIGRHLVRSVRDRPESTVHAAPEPSWTPVSAGAAIAK